MYKVVICDDEKYFRDYIGELVGEYLDKRKLIYNVDYFSSGEEILSLKNNIKNYDIIFLDINMSGISGIETAKQIREISPNIFLVFISGYLTYSLEGYKVDAFRYLIKDDKSIRTTMLECMNAFLGRQDQLNIKRTFQFIEGEQTILLDQIIYIESNLHKLTFFIEGRENTAFTMYEKLDRIEYFIDCKFFCRIHKSFLVNLRQIAYIDRYTATLKNGIVLNIAKPRFSGVKTQFISYIME